MNQIICENLGLIYKNQWVFKELNFTINKNEFISIVGPSGCGKSSLLNILAGTLVSSSGKVMVDTEEITGLNAHFAYMPQDDLLFNSKTVIQNISLYQKIHKLDINHTQNEQLLKEFGLYDVKDSYPDELSGGMKQRVAFLRTVLVDRDILLLDEPFGALDIFTRQTLQDWLKKIAKQLNKTIILVTHDIDEALYLSDRIFVMGNTPSSILSEVDLTDQNQTREWLIQQGELKESIYKKIKHTSEA